MAIWVDLTRLFPKRPFSIAIQFSVCQSQKVPEAKASGTFCFCIIAVMEGGNMSPNAQFVIDAEGNKTAVILPIEEYEDLLEDLHLSQVARESKDEERIPWEQVRAELVAEGKLD